MRPEAGRYLRKASQFMWPTWKGKDQYVSPVPRLQGVSCRGDTDAQPLSPDSTLLKTASLDLMNHGAKGKNNKKRGGEDNIRNKDIINERNAKLLSNITSTSPTQ